MVLAESVCRQSLSHKAHQSMESNTADRSQVPEPVGNNYKNMTYHSGDESWGSTGHSNATKDQVLTEPTTTALSFAPPLYNNRSDSSFLNPTSNHCPTGVRSSYHAIQPRTNHPATFDTGFTIHPGGPNHTSCPSNPSTFDITDPYDPFGLIGSGSTSHESCQDAIKQPVRPHSTNCGLGQQLPTPPLVAETNRYDTSVESFLFNFDGSSLDGQRNLDASDALVDNRPGYILSEDSATSYTLSFENDRHEGKNPATYMYEYEGPLVEYPSRTSPVWLQGNHIRARSASDPSSPSRLSPQDSPPPSSSSLLSKSVSNTPPDEESWKCDNCGRLLTTKGTKNRNRNKRRHRCPGTGPKYPCAVCPKSFNRGDTRLLHLRKLHPEIHIEPPRLRKRKDPCEKKD